MSKSILNFDLTFLSLSKKLVAYKTKKILIPQLPFLKVAFFQRVRCVFHIAKIDIPNHYPVLEI